MYIRLAQRHSHIPQDPAHPTAGIEGMKLYLHDLKEAFPDFAVVVSDSSWDRKECLVVGFYVGKYIWWNRC